MDILPWYCVIIILLKCKIWTPSCISVITLWRFNHSTNIAQSSNSAAFCLLYSFYKKFPTDKLETSWRATATVDQDLWPWPEQCPSASATTHMDSRTASSFRLTINRQNRNYHKKNTLCKMHNRNKNIWHILQVYTINKTQTSTQHITRLS